MVQKSYKIGTNYCPAGQLPWAKHSLDLKINRQEEENRAVTVDSDTDKHTPVSEEHAQQRVSNRDHS